MKSQKKKYKSPQVQQTTIKRIMTKFKRRKKLKNDKIKNNFFK